MATNPRHPVRISSSGASVDAIAEERRLMERVSAGDEQALCAIYDRYSAQAYTLAFHVLREPSAAEDIAQEVFLRLWREPQAFDSTRGSLSAWISINARHRAVDHWRKYRRESQGPEDFEFVEPSGTMPECNADMEKVRKILRSLPGPLRDVVELSYFGGLSHAEIASHTSLPLGTVKSRIRKALQSVRKVLSPEVRRPEVLRKDIGLV
ncbi:MAG: sigma-70 family RNA polymerase sigma factor [Terriglobales bacterium]